MSRVDKLREFLQASPNDSFLQHALALEYIKTGDDAAARELFETILTRDPCYIGSYYHLAKLLERSGDPQLASEWYARGMEQAKAAGDNHALNELRSALEELTDQ